MTQPTMPMPGTVRAVQIILWILVVLGAIAVILGAIGAAAVGSLSADALPPGQEVPSAGALWLAVVVGAIFLVAELILVIRLPKGQANTRTALIVLFALSIVWGIVSLALIEGTNTASAGAGAVIPLILIGLLMSGGAKEYFTQ